MSLTFSEAAHRYRMTVTPGKATDYTAVTGVTTIIDGGIPKPGLIRWSGNTVAEFALATLATASPRDVARWQEAAHAAEQGDTAAQTAIVRLMGAHPNRIRDAAGERGTAVHDLCQRILLGEAVEVPTEYEAHISGFMDLLDKFDIQPLIIDGHPMVEVSVGNREHWYSGRLDCLGTIGAFGGLVALIDWKTSKHVYGDTSLQTAPYAKAEFWVTDEDPDTERPLPVVDCAVVAHITENGSWLHWLSRDRVELEESFEDFTHALHTHRNKKRREQRLSIPLEPTAQRKRTA